MTASPTAPDCTLNHHAHCANCRLAGICLPISLEFRDIEMLDNIIQRSRPVQSKAAIYRAGDDFHSVYAVRSGAIKTVKITEDGIEQITGFRLPGELFGVDGLAQNSYTNSAIALETSSICEIPFHRLEELSLSIPSLQRRFFQLMSKEIVEEQELITLLSKNNAEQRMAAFLLSLSLRFKHRAFSETDFFLPMPRSDIANYLGLTIETVSRVLTRMHKSKLISLDKKHIQINDMQALSARYIN